MSQNQALSISEKAASQRVGSRIRREDENFTSKAFFARLAADLLCRRRSGDLEKRRGQLSRVG
jgi:hypothetical protein